MKRKTPKLNGPDDDRLAAKWGCDCRTIRRWRKAGAPFGNPKRLREWLSSRKHLPAGTAALLETTRTAEASAFKQEPPLPEGAAGALQRLEQAEARAFSAFKAATEGGDSIVIKSSRENWLRISESLRRFDVALEMSRRDSGSLIPLADGKAMVGGFVQWFLAAITFGLETACPRLVGLQRPEEVWTILDQVLRDSTTTALANCRVRSYNGVATLPTLIEAAEEAVKTHANIGNLAAVVAAKEKALREIYRQFCEAMTRDATPDLEQSK